MQCILQDRHLASLIFVFVFVFGYFKVSHDHKYIVFHIRRL